MVFISYIYGCGADKHSFIHSFILVKSSWLLVCSLHAATSYVHTSGRTGSGFLLGFIISTKSGFTWLISEGSPGQGFSVGEFKCKYATQLNAMNTHIKYKGRLDRVTTRFLPKITTFTLIYYGYYAYLLYNYLPNKIQLDVGSVAPFQYYIFT